MSARPKRKATQNRTYVDAIDESIFEDKSKNKKLKVSKSQLANGTVGTNNGGGPGGNSNSKQTNGSGKEQLRVPYNWQPPPKPIDFFSNRLNLSDAYIDLDQQILFCPKQEIIADDYDYELQEGSADAFTVRKGSYIYMVSEPPGEPYYIGRVMGFKSKKYSVATTGVTHDISKYGFQIQWFYRPRDISKVSSDSRLLFASMHTDTCPLISFRGVANVRHKEEIDNFDEFIKRPNSFYFNKLFDRYMIKFYDIISTQSLMKIIENDSEGKNKSKNFITALNKRFEYIFVETTATKSLTTGLSANSCTCEVCGQWCSNQDSVSCASCDNFYHMFCLDPPLLKKPSRGFSWTCAVCTKKHDMEYKSKKMIMLSHDNKSSNENEIVKDSSEPETESEDSIIVKTDSSELPRYELMAIEFLKKDAGHTLEQRRLKEEWCMRYLGMHAKLEDGVDLEDRSPYPRASTRIGAKHQATNIPEYVDHPIVYYDNPHGHAATTKKGKKQIKDDEDLTPLALPKEYEGLKPKDLPQWLQHRPKGYIERGVDDGKGTTCSLLWKPSEEDQSNNFEKLDSYVAKCEPIAKKLDLSPNSPNFVDAILKFWMDCKGNGDKALDKAKSLSRKSLKEPTLSEEEIKLFEDGIRANGSELYPTFKLVQSQPCSMIVRYYYIWKKTQNGRLIWGNYEGRKKKKIIDETQVKPEEKIDLQNDEDDSSYDGKKIESHDKKFTCKHCHTGNSVRWFRITGFEPQPKSTNPRKKDPPAVGLCFRCARLWRRYAVIWEEPLEVDRKVNKTIGGWKRKIEYELLRDANEILIEALDDGQGIFLDEEPTPRLKKKSLTSSEGRKSTSKTPPPNSSVAEPSAKSRKVVVKEEETKRTKAKRTRPEPVVKSEPVEPELKVEKKVPTKRKPQVKSENNVVKRPKRDPIDQIINPLTNPDYIRPDGLSLNLTGGKSLFDHNQMANVNAINKFIEDRRLRSLIDFNGRYRCIDNNGSQPNFALDTTNGQCTLCEEGTENTKTNDLMICSNCGVNVHASCVGLNIPPVVEKPVRQWLCKCCINNLRPTYTTQYTCCLCYAVESKLELSLPGQSSTKKDYLYPVLESGRWCHLTCALFNYQSVNIKPNNPPPSIQKKYTKDELKNNITASRAAIEGIYQSFNIQNVSEIFLQNYSTACGICHLKNGSLTACTVCKDKKFHVSCAQADKNFKVGFQLVDQNDNDKEAKVVKVGSATGRLEPAILCAEHQHQEGVFGLRELGRRFHGSTKEESKPLIQLFVEDVSKHSLSKFTGPQLKAYNYLNHIKMFVEKEAKRNPSGKCAQVVQSSLDKDKIVIPTACAKCTRGSSPMWWPQGSTDSYLCQSCYHEEKEEDNGEEDEESSIKYFTELVNSPITAANSGLKSIDDRITDVYKPLDLTQLRQRPVLGSEPLNLIT